MRWMSTTTEWDGMKLHERGEATARNVNRGALITAGDRWERRLFLTLPLNLHSQSDCLPQTHSKSLIKRRTPGHH